MLDEAQLRLGISYLFVSHDLAVAVVRLVADRVIVMYLDPIVEAVPVARLFDSPGHPYTRALPSSVPLPERRHQGGPRFRLTGEPRSLAVACYLHGSGGHGRGGHG